MRRPAAALAAVAVAAVLAAGCQDAQDPAVDAGGTTSSTPAATAAPSSPPVSTPAVEPRGYLTAVAAGEGPVGTGSSRLVFEFDGPVPGYFIDYVDRPVTEDGSGEEVEVTGEAVLLVRFENAGLARVEGEQVIPTYTGDRRVAATGPEGTAVELVSIGDFEGVVTWAVGLRHRVPSLSATTLAGPSRLVLDLPGA